MRSVRSLSCMFVMGSSPLRASQGVAGYLFHLRRTQTAENMQE